MTNQQTQASISRPAKRSKHPARSARIISSGIAIASTLGISSAYTIAARAETMGNQVQNNSILTLPQNLLATVPGISAVTAPTQPAPAAIATPKGQATVVVNISPPAPQVQWTPPATSGSN